MNNDEIERLKSAAQIVRESGANEGWSCYTILALIAKVESLARDNLELTRRYEEQKLQEKRLEVALQRAKVGHDPELSKAIEEVLYHNQVNGVFTSLTEAIERLAKIAKVK